jgi:cell wall assembly regulator SMI1
MHKIAEVEAAKQLMTEAKDWSVWHWLTEKRRVRVAADAATAALERAEKKVKAEWPEDVRKLYPAAVRDVKKADDAAYKARMDAEATFDEAERRLSASMAREGAQKAIDSYCLHEHAIRKAEAVARNKVSG